MNTRSSSSSWLVLWVWPLAVMAVLAAFAITSRSLWIDEAWTAHLAQEPTLGAWWAELSGEKVTDLQMPLYSFWIWGVEKIFGSSELALRAVNVFWFAPALLLLVRAFPASKLPGIAAMLVAACSPFAWYYLNEARSYTMQLSCGLMVFTSLARLAQGGFASDSAERRWVWVFAGALVLLCGSSLLAMLLAIAPLLILPVVIPLERMLGLLSRHARLVLVTVLLLAGLAVYYLWTLSLGARATSIAGTDWKNPVFVTYELMGFAGLGPGRAEIREGGVHVFRPYVGWLAVYGMAVGGLMVWGLLAVRRRLGAKRWVIVVFAVLAPAAFVFAASYLKHFRVLGRHFAALAPVVMLLLAFGVAGAWRRSRSGRMLVLLFFALSLGSALSLRFASRHEKDNYRAAAALAKAALDRSEAVWWNADFKGANYYQVPLAGGVGMNQIAATYLMNPEAASLNALARPEWIICGRSDVYDGGGAMAEYLTGNRYRVATNITGFAVWTTLGQME